MGKATFTHTLPITHEYEFGDRLGIPTTGLFANKKSESHKLKNTF
jgi:hypothetical protein